jgi:hypothetical protein
LKLKCYNQVLYFYKDHIYNKFIMKSISKILMLSAVVSLSAFTKAESQGISVKLQLTRPARYEENERHHPPAPSPNHIWVAEEWVGNGRGGYDYRPGYWVLPPKEQWVPGYWNKRHHGLPGYVWVPGHWAVWAGNHWSIVQ